jgi:two-component system, NtrC family, sensor kinase
VALACAPLAVALLTEGRWAGGGARALLLVGFGLALAVVAALALRRVDARPDREAEARERSLRQARDQQAATAEILSAMAASPPDLQRVLDTIARNAARVCDGLYAVVFRVDGTQIRLAAHHDLSPARLAALGQRYPRRLDDEDDEGGPMTRAIRDASMVHHPDLLSDPGVPAWLREVARTESFRSLVIVPMLREGRPLGTLNVSRPEGGFSERQIQLLRTFADQAVIAIENVRLFQELQARNRELTEALEQQTATSEILQAISASPTDLGPVFDTILRSAVQLCAGFYSVLFRFDGERLDLTATHNVPPEGLEALRCRYPLPIASDEAGLAARAVRERRPQHVTDMQSDPGLPAAVHLASEAVGQRAAVAVPMFREGEPVGALTVSRREAREFSAKELALLQTFAAQAVIAIENVRLFRELQARNRELTESLEQQTATSEILRVISSSPTNLEPVMDAVTRNARKLARADHALIGEASEGRIRWLATSGCPLVSEGPPISRQLPSGRAILDCQTTQVEDVTELTEDFPGVRRAYPEFGVRTILATPLVREGLAIGVLLVRRTTMRSFTGKEIELLRTFADQAVIAIENVRLFTELQARNRELTESLEQQTATAEILRVISTSPTNLEPVLDAVVKSAARFCGAPDASVFRLDGEALRAVAHHGPVSQPTGFLVPVVRGSVAGRSLLERQAVGVTDLQVETEEFPEGSALARQTGQRATLGVPLLREGVPIGVILLRRAEAVPFTDKQIARLQTFADQAVIAIENVRLFTELQDKNRALAEAHAHVTEALEQQTATAEILRVISSSPTDVQPTFDAIAASATRLCEALQGSVFRFDGTLIHLAAHYGSRSHTP